MYTLYSPALYSSAVKTLSLSSKIFTSQLLTGTLEGFVTSVDLEIKIV